MSAAPLSGKRVLLLSPGVPHPSRGASTVLFYNYIRGIAESGCQVLQLMLLDRLNLDQPLLDEYDAATADLGDLQAVPCVFDQLYGVNRWSRSPRVGSLSAETLAQAKAFAPDVVVSFDILCAAYAQQIGVAAPRVVWLGDLNFETFLYHAWYDIAERPVSALRLPLVRVACGQWRRFYKRVLTGTRTIIVASKSSEAAMAKLGVPAKYLPYPWPVERSQRVAQARPEKPTFVFFGSLSGLGSRSAFHLLLNAVYPALVKAWGAQGFQILLAGSRTMPDWAGRDVRDRPEFVFRGFVDDLGALLAECHATLFPIAVPVGNRSRIVTAMAHGSLVIAHTNTSLGNPHLVTGENCFLAASPAEFVDGLRTSVEAPQRVAAICRAARATYELYFAPAGAIARFVNEIAAAMTLSPQGQA